MLVILFWLIVVGVLVYFIVRWAQGEAVINNQASGISSVERDEDPEPQVKTIPRMAGIPRAYEPQEDIREVAAQLRENASEDATQDTPVYLGDNSSVVSVHLK